LREINDISKRLREKKKDIDDIKEREEALMAKFHELCPEGSDKYDEIRKFFEKITKRRKHKLKAEKAEGGEDEEEEEEEEEFEEDEEEDEDENNVVSLP
jgi:ABC-type transporter lipoprotein component MlaA